MCVNTIGVDEARHRTSDLPVPITWRPVSRDEIPASIRACLHGNMAEGMAWKLAPVRLYPDQHEAALDNGLHHVDAA